MFFWDGTHALGTIKIVFPEHHYSTHYLTYSFRGHNSLNYSHSLNNNDTSRYWVDVDSACELCTVAGRYQRPRKAVQSHADFFIRPHVRVHCCGHIHTGSFERGWNTVCVLVTGRLCPIFCFVVYVCTIHSFTRSMFCLSTTQTSAFIINSFLKTLYHAHANEERTSSMSEWETC